jgi:hypothetical protein
MTANSLPAPFAPIRPSVFEQLSVLAAATTVGLAWWMGVQPSPPPEPAVCAAANRVSYAQVEGARQRVRDADAAWSAAIGPALTRARIGVPPGEAAVRAEAAARELAAARTEWTRLCG